MTEDAHARLSTFGRLPRREDDPAHAPGPGTPEADGLTSRELLGILRGLAGSNVVSADVVEVSPAHDHAEIRDNCQSRGV